PRRETVPGASVLIAGGLRPVATLCVRSRSIAMAKASLHNRPLRSPSPPWGEGERRGGGWRLSLPAWAGLVALSVCVLTCGCTSLQDYLHNGFKVGPNYGRPPAPVAQDWIDAADVRVRKDSDDLSRW